MLLQFLTGYYHRIPFQLLDCIGGSEDRRGLRGRDAELRGGDAAGPQGHPLRLFTLLPRHLAAEPSPAPSPLPERGQVPGAAGSTQLHVHGRGQCGAGRGN